jgi:hypothetical protein
MELDTTWSFKMQEVKLGDHIMFSSSSLIDTVLVNSYKGFMFQTKSQETAQRLTAYLKNTFENITTHTDNGVVSSMFLDQTCDQVLQAMKSKEQFLTLVTQYDTGHTLSFDAKDLFYNSPDGKATCLFGFTILLGDIYEQDRLILGQSFLSKYNVSMNFDKQTIGLEGALLPPP